LILQSKNLPVIMRARKVVINMELTRNTSLKQSVIPFRAPEITKEIYSFSAERLFYCDQKFDISYRFEKWDLFRETFQSWSNVNLSDFYVYPTAGATEAINDCFNDLRYQKTCIALLENEYQYYVHLAETFKIPYRILKSEIDLPRQGDIFITSTPFCRSGEISDFQKKILSHCEMEGIEVWIDAVYLGACEQNELILPATTTNIFFSFSKQFGLALNRIGAWASKKIRTEKSILLQHGYYSVGAIDLVTYLLEKFDKNWLYRNYNFLQKKITPTPTKIVYQCATNGCITQKMIEYL
jgi:hypothetical protein